MTDAPKPPAERQAVIDANRAARSDFDSWNERVSKNYGSPEARLAKAASNAKFDVMQWENAVDSFVTDVRENPTATLAWSGRFIEKSARRYVAMELLRFFEAGVPTDEIVAEFSRQAFENVDTNPSSRSDSVMANLVEDCHKSAVAKTYATLVGHLV